MANSSGDWHDSLDHAERTDVGMRRPNNQDAYAVDLATDREHWLQRGHLLVVADGMGAHAAGELASQIAVEQIPEVYHQLRDLPPAAAITESIVKANLLIHTQGQVSTDYQGMGTTCSALLLLPDGALVAHVGDSRVYRQRNVQIEQLTFDHSLLWEMMAVTRMSEEQIPVTVPKNVITRSLGPNPTVEIDLEGPFSVEPGDRFLLCSDGLTGLVHDPEIGMILANLPIPDAVQTLVDLANLRGGNDNITVLGLAVGPRWESHGAAPADGWPHRRTTRDRRLQATLWTVAGLCLVAALVTLVAALWWPAMCCLAGGLTLAAVAWTRTTGPPRPTTTPRKAPRLGPGPHRVSDCRPTKALLDALANDLRDAHPAAGDDAVAADHGADVQRCRAQAEAAVARSDLPAAVAQYTRAVRLLASSLPRDGGSPDGGLPAE